MSTINVTNLKHASSGSNNIVLDSSGNATVAGTLANTGNLTITSGNLVLSNGNGIDFSAAGNAAGMTSELLNDYEQGTWTPAVRGGSTAGTYQLAVATGKYTKIGNQVHILCNITLASSITGGGAGFLQITGLPFAHIANNQWIGAVYVDGVDISDTCKYLVSSPDAGSSVTTFALHEINDNAARTYVQITGVSANDIIYTSFSYPVA